MQHVLLPPSLVVAVVVPHVLVAVVAPTLPGPVPRPSLASPAPNAECVGLTASRSAVWPWWEDWFEPDREEWKLGFEAEVRNPPPKGLSWGMLVEPPTADNLARPY